MKGPYTALRPQRDVSLSGLVIGGKGGPGADPVGGRTLEYVLSVRSRSFKEERRGGEGGSGRV